jgi:mannose-6-phosphate isomerase-like protein (cupin superfamily)
MAAIRGSSAGVEVKALSVGTLLATSCVLAIADVPSHATAGATYLSAAEVMAKVATTGSGVGYQVPSSAGYKVLIIRRDTSGDAEVHMEMNDTIIVEQGHGQFWVGGQINGNREISPGEWRGGEISGARKIDVSVGDLVLIPAGTPHRAVVTAEKFTYLTIKTPKAHGSLQ